MIVIDENVEQYWIDRIANLGFEYISVRHEHKGLSDIDVIGIVTKVNGLLITEDKDFGELVFSHKIRGASVLFLRYDQPNYGQIEHQLIRILEAFMNGEVSGFITLTKNKVRIRKI